jgi:hypothetical protein
LSDPPPGSGAAYEPVIRKADALPAAPADDGNVNETITDALGAMLGTVGNGVTALADPRIALTTTGFAATLPEFVTLNTAKYWPLPFTDRDCSVEVICATGATTVSVVLLEMPFKVAPMVVVPAAAAVAKPDELIAAVAGVPEVHVALVVTFCVVPSLYVPVAVNCSVAPVISVGFAGLIAIACSVASVTVSVAELLVTVPDVALIVALPTPAPVASPVALIVATVVADELHVAVFVRFCVLPSLYVPVAVNCCVAPFAIEGAAGVTAIDCSVAAVPVSVAVFEVTPFIVAVTLVEPMPVTVARPVAAIVAAAVFDEVQVTCVVRFCVVLSLKVPTALYCCV